MLRYLAGDYFRISVFLNVLWKLMNVYAIEDNEPSMARCPLCLPSGQTIAEL